MAHKKYKVQQKNMFPFLEKNRSNLICCIHQYCKYDYFTGKIPLLMKSEVKFFFTFLRGGVSGVGRERVRSSFFILVTTYLKLLTFALHYG